MYYTNLEHLCDLYDSCVREYAYKAGTIEEYEEWKTAAKKRLIEITGMEYCRRAPLQADMKYTVKENGFIKEYWTIQTEPDVYMPFYLLKPAEAGKYPAVIVAHGHGGCKEQTVGNIKNPGVISQLKANGDTPFALQLVQAGYLVACPDARGSGERREFVQHGDTADNWKSNSHRELQHMALGFGQCMVGLMTWDLQRLVDFLQEHPQIDGERIGCAGMSGGGQQTLWLAALDDRIRIAVTSGYFYGMKESLVKLPQNCDCNYVPFMWRTMDMGDLGALIAPRALLVESGRHDHLNGAPGLDNVYPQIETARRAYSLLNAPDKLIHSVHEGVHEWNGKDVLPFIKKWL